MNASHCKWIIGAEPFVGAAVAAWRTLLPGLEVRTLVVGQGANYDFDLSPLEALGTGADSGEVSGFVAFGPQFLNLRRFELMGLAKERGLRLPALVALGALVAGDIALPENTWIAAGAIVGAGTRIGFNAHVGAGAIVGEGTVLGNSCWIESGAVLGRGCKVGANALVGRGVILEDGVEVGKSAVIAVPGRRSTAVPARTFIDPAFDEAVVVVGA